MRSLKPLLLGLALLGLAVGWLSFFLTPTLAGLGNSAGPNAYLPLVFVSPGINPVPPPLGDWLAYVNYYREMAKLPAVTKDASLSDGGWLHSRYIVKNDILQHSEDPSNPWYTPDGKAAGESGNLSASYYVDVTDEAAIDSWMQAPFHAVGILDPALQSTGLGSYRETDGGFQMGATLDVVRGLGEIPVAQTFPVFWPAEGMTVPLAMHWGENPSPLASCPGYTAPSGLPIILQLGDGGLVPDVTSTSLARNGAQVEHCVFDETNYSNPDGYMRDLGRAILDGRDAVVLVPRTALTPGSAYTVSVTARGATYTWWFRVSSSASLDGGLGASLP